MSALEIVTWIALGFALGAVAHFLSPRKPAWVEAFVVGAVGALVGGYLLRDGTPGIYSGKGLLTAGVGAIVLLYIDGLFRRKDRLRFQG